MSISGSHHGASEIGSDADGVPSEVTESYNNTDDMSPDIHIKKVFSCYIIPQCNIT